MRRVPNNTKYSENELSNIKSISLLLDSMLKAKMNDNSKHFFEIIKMRNMKNKKYGKLLAIILGGISSRKKTQFLKFGYRKLQNNLLTQRQKQLKEFQELDHKVKQKSANILGTISKKLYYHKLKTNFRHLFNQTKTFYHAKNFKIQHLNRIINELICKRFQMGIQKLKNNQMFMLRKKSKFLFIDKLLSSKKKFNIFSAFLKLKSNLKIKVQKEIEKPAVVPKQKINQVSKPMNKAQQNKQQQQIDQKTRKIQRQIDQLQREKQRVISQHNKQIKKYQKQQQSLKFNNDILDESIKQLQNQLIQRQKKNVKKLPNSQLWQRVYSNLLLVYSTSNQPLTRQKLLQALECPLAPINVDIDAMKMENKVLEDLIIQYKKFYEASHQIFEAKQDILPYDILVAKNKFLFSAVEALIEQGIGSQKQVQQLSEEISSLTKTY